jgi:hypothetical protein
LEVRYTVRQEMSFNRTTEFLQIISGHHLDGEVEVQYQGGTQAELSPHLELGAKKQARGTSGKPKPMLQSTGQ